MGYNHKASVGDNIETSVPMNIKEEDAPNSRAGTRQAKRLQHGI